MDIRLENLNSYMFQNIDLLIAAGVLEEKKIVLFGLNSSSYNTKNYLECKGYSIYAYIDNDDRKRDLANDALEITLKKHVTKDLYEKISGQMIRAYAPEELLITMKEELVVLIASKYYTQMCQQLELLGYEENKHIFQTVNFYDLDKVISKMEGIDADLVELNSAQVQEFQLDILRFVKKVCKEHHLRYYMCGGTLLGAVRHGGYIPWDDDIDLAMPLPDYKKFIQIILNDDRYVPLSQYTNQDNYFNFFMRILDSTTVMKFWEYPFLMTTGVSIDIFPLFGIPEKREDIDYFYNKIRKINEQYINSFIENINENEEIKEHRRFLHKEIIKLMEVYEFDKSTNIGYLLSKYKEKEIMPRSIYEKSILLDFEGEKFSAAGGYQEYLTILFHDYMQLPPEKDRFNTHSYKAFKRQK